MIRAAPAPGCGLGTYVERLRVERPDLEVLAFHLSAGMRPRVVGDVQALPLPDAWMGGALAMHMLYHVPDIPVAVAELRRVLKPDGVLVVSTNGPEDKAEIGRLFTDAIRNLTGTAIELSDGDSRFTTEHVNLLRDEFETVDVAVFERETLIPEVEPVIAYVDSTRALTEAVVRPHVPWEMFLDAVRVRVVNDVLASGHWRLRNQVGLLTCR